MIDVSHDGRRVYMTNALHTDWDRQFYPDGIRGWMAKVDTGVSGRAELDPRFFVEFEDGVRPHQVRLHAVDLRCQLSPFHRACPRGGAHAAVRR